MSSKAQDDDLVMNLVDLALAQTPDQRQSYLRQACTGDDELYSQVWNYVQWEQRMNGFLLDPLFRRPEAEDRFDPDELLLDRFRIVREVGEGGMGIVYEAMDQRLTRRIALKRAKVGFRRRLPPEVRNASEIAHPNVCKIFEIHTASTPHGETDFITMEFLEGQTLAERLTSGTLPEQDALDIARQLCAGLAEAHRKGVIHGDLKSNNVILTKAAEGGMRAVITDFGLARTPGASQPGMQSDVGGNPDYMAPELWKGEKPSVASDVYGLGVILCELFARRRPFAADVPMEERLSRKPPAMHTKWDRVLARCLDPDPAKRFASVGELAVALRSRTQRRLLTAAGAVAAVVLVAIGVVAPQWVNAPLESESLAVLPFVSDPASAALAEGLLLDTGDRLDRLKPGRTRLTVIPLADAIQNKVDQPVKARTVLGASYALHGELRTSGGRVVVTAYLTDTRTRVQLGEWHAEYPMNQVGNLPVALAGMITGTLHLPPLAVAATVNAAAYPDFAAGISLTRRDDVDRAIPLLERAVAADPGSPLTHARLGEAEGLKHRMTKDPLWLARAMASLKNAEQRNPDLAVVRFVSGLVRYNLGQYEQAETDLLRAVELEPFNGDAWRLLGGAYESGNRLNLALAAFQKALDAQPEYFKNHYGLGRYYYHRDDYPEAVRHFRRAVDLAPDLAVSHFALGAAYQNMSRHQDAEYEMRIAISLQETSESVNGLGVSLLYQGRDREAIPHFERAIEIGPPSALHYLNLGTVLRRSNIPQGSVEAYRKARDLAEVGLAQNPRNGNERGNLAYIYARLNERKRAEFEAAQALQIAGKENNVRWMVALTYEALGRHDLTLELIKDAPAILLDRLNRFPDLADLRGNSRFQELLASHQIR